MPVAGLVVIVTMNETATDADTAAVAVVTTRTPVDDVYEPVNVVDPKPANVDTVGDELIAVPKFGNVTVIVVPMAMAIGSVKPMVNLAPEAPETLLSNDAVTD